MNENENKLNAADGCGCNHDGCDCGHDDCGCGHDHEIQTVIIEMDDDTQITCGVLDIFEVGGNDYIALMPVDSNDGEVLIYRFSHDGENARIDEIESDDEYQKVAEVFTEFFNDIDADEE